MIYTSQPAEFETAFQVAAVYIFVQDKILLLERLIEKPQGGLFGLPAGKVDPGESVVTALLREVEEETGLILPPEELSELDTFWVEHDSVRFSYHTFKVTLTAPPKVTIRPNEHAGYCWVTLADSLKLPLVEDQEFCTRHTFDM